MRHCLLIILFLFCQKTGFSQEAVAPKYTFLQKRFFLGATAACFYDYFWAPKSFNNSEVYGQKDYSAITLGSIALDLRLNIKDLSERTSFSFNFPVTVCFSAANAGVGSTYFPFLLQFNYGYHSTYNNMDHSGFTVGGGYMLIAFPLFKPAETRTKVWGDMVFKAGYKNDSREMKNFEVMIGVLNGFSFRVGYGFVIGY